MGYGAGENRAYLPLDGQHHHRVGAPGASFMIAPRNEYSRVTEVLSPFSGMEYVPGPVLAHACERGSRVHAMCEAIVRGEGAWDLDEELAPYVQSFEKWWARGHKVISIEERFHCPEMMLTGQVDLILSTPEGAIILDIKTSRRPSKVWPLQGSAYCYLARQHSYPVVGMQFLHLLPDGREGRIYEYPEQWDLFCKCLDVYNYFFKKKKRK